MMRPFVFDMETGDPDDFFTLALLGGHPAVDLRAVTVTPGTPHQVGIVRYGLLRLGLDIPVGAFNLDHMKARGTPDERYVSCVSSWHYKTFGDIKPSRDAEPGWKILDTTLGPDTTLVTGGPLKNLGSLLTDMSLRIYDRPPNLGRIVVQGGFAGEGVVPPDKQLDKFKGLTTCPTYNLNGDPGSALSLLESRYFHERRFVGKNVCHGVIYDQAMQDRVMNAVHYLPNGRHRDSLLLIVRGMAAYLHKNPGGKKFHDPLAACCAIKPDIGEWAEVEVFREKGQWGSRLSPGSGIWALIDYDRDLFIRTLCGENTGIS